MNRYLEGASALKASLGKRKDHSRLLAALGSLRLVK